MINRLSSCLETTICSQRADWHIANHQKNPKFRNIKETPIPLERLHLHKKKCLFTNGEHTRKCSLAVKNFILKYQSQERTYGKNKKR